MKKPAKVSIWIVGIIAALFVAFFFLNRYVEKKITVALEDRLKRVYATYDKVDVELLKRKAQITGPVFSVKGKVLKVDSITLQGISLWEYIKNKNIRVGSLKIDEPRISIYNFKQDSSKVSADSTSNNKKKSSGNKLKNIITIDDVQISGGRISLYEKDSTNHQLYSRIRNLNIGDLKISSKTLEEKVPFEYNIIKLNIDSVFYDLDKQHRMFLKDLSMNDHEIVLQGFQIKPKYSREEHQQTTPVEKDRYDLDVDSIHFQDISWDLEKDTLEIRNPRLTISGVDFNIYRDKTLPDDNSYKSLYSESLRKLPMKLIMDSILVRNTSIKYEERIKADMAPGMVEFANLNASIANLNNTLGTGENSETRIKARTKFMKDADLEVDWSFKIADKRDRFQISGSLSGLAAEEMNRFFKPALNIEASGQIKDMFFNFQGNNDQANGDMRMEYSDFKVEVLRKDGREKNKVLSAIANVFVRNKALNEKARHKEVTATRDKSKSFWNYFWTCIKNGALKSFI